MGSMASGVTGAAISGSATGSAGAAAGSGAAGVTVAAGAGAAASPGVVNLTDTACRLAVLTSKLYSTSTGAPAEIRENQAVKDAYLGDLEV